MTRPAPPGGGRCGALYILFKHQPFFYQLSRGSGDRFDMSEALIRADSAELVASRKWGPLGNRQFHPVRHNPTSSALFIVAVP